MSVNNKFNAKIVVTNRIKKYYVWLSLVVFTLTVLAVWKGGEALKNQRIKTLRVDSAEQLNQLASVLESAIAKYQHMPTLLASNDRVKKALRKGLVDDIDQLNRELEQINRITEASDSYILNTDGLTIAASNYRDVNSFIGGNFAFRPYFKNAMEGQLGRYYALGTTSNLRGYYFSYPVYEQGDVIGVAVVKVDLTQFEKRFANQRYEFLLLDPDNIVFSSSKANWLYRVLGELSSADLQRIADSQRYFGQRIEKLTVYQQTPFADGSQIVTVLENASQDSGEGPRQSYLKMNRPIQLLDFKVATFTPLKTIEEEISLWRTIFAGGVTITVLLFGLAVLRRKMLRERSYANEMARHNQAYIREVIQNTQAGLVTLDEEHKVESFNPAVEQLIGQPLAPLVGQPLSALFMPENTKEQALMSREGFLTATNHKPSRVLTQEGYLYHGDQPSVPVEMTLCEMQLPDRLSYLVTFHDMTERKHYEQEITEARLELEQRVRERTYELEGANTRLRQEIEEHKGTQRELIQTAKLAVLGQLSAGLNHELNQPLTAIRAFAGNGLKFLDRGQYQQAHANLQHISQLGQHMGDIIARFKVFARKGDVQQGPIAVQTAIMGGLKIMGPRYKEVGIELVVTPDQGFIVNGDMVFLEQVLVNLLANAADAILEAPDHQRRVQIEQTATQDHVTICVHDSGKGLSDQAILHLFEPFFTSKPSGLGLGLGLSISQRIVEAMGGRISAHNRGDGGAEFCVSLPRFQSLDT